MNEEMFERLKQEGLGYFYCWNQDKVWEFGDERKKELLPFGASNFEDACSIKPISRIRAMLLGVPWLIVGDVKITTAEKSKKAQENLMGRVIFFHTPLDKGYYISREFRNPFVIWNRTRGNRTRPMTGPELTIIGEYESTFPLADMLSRGPQEYLLGLSQLFDIPNEKVSYFYENQNTFELYDPTRRPKLRRITQNDASN
jgi:hypothetical protein